MAKITFTPALRMEYENLFNTCSVSSIKESGVETIVAKLLANQGGDQMNSGRIWTYGV